MSDFENGGEYCPGYDEYCCPECGSDAIIEDGVCSQDCEENGVECDCDLYHCTECGNTF